MIGHRIIINIELLLKCDSLHIVQCDLIECGIRFTYHNEIELCYYDYSIITTALILAV